MSTEAKVQSVYESILSLSSDFDFEYSKVGISPSNTNVQLKIDADQFKGHCDLWFKDLASKSGTANPPSSGLVIPPGVRFFSFAYPWVEEGSEKVDGRYKFSEHGKPVLSTEKVLVEFVTPDKGWWAFGLQHILHPAQRTFCLSKTPFNFDGLSPNLFLDHNSLLSLRLNVGFPGKGISLEPKTKYYLTAYITDPAGFGDADVDIFVTPGRINT